MSHTTHDAPETDFVTVEAYVRNQLFTGSLEGSSRRLRTQAVLAFKLAYLLDQERGGVRVSEIDRIAEEARRQSARGSARHSYEGLTSLQRLRLVRTQLTLLTSELLQNGHTVNGIDLLPAGGESRSLEILWANELMILGIARTCRLKLHESPTGDLELQE